MHRSRHSFPPHKHPAEQFFQPPPPPPPPGSRPHVSALRQHSWTEASFDASNAREGEARDTVANGPAVWFISLPEPLSRSNLTQVCSQYGSVQQVIFPPATEDKALVIFENPSEAMQCCKGIQSCKAYASGRRFCVTIPAAGISNHAVQYSTFLWIGGPPSFEYESEIVNCFRCAGMRFPRHIIRVEGHSHGFVLELQTLEMVNEALEVLKPLSWRFSPVTVTEPSSSKKRSRLQLSHSVPDDRSKSHKVTGRRPG